MSDPPRIRTPRRSRAKHEWVNLGLGDYAWPGSGLRSQRFAQGVFLEVVAEVCPNVIVELHRELLTPYRALLQATGSVLSPEDCEEITADENYSLAPAAAVLRAELRDWGRRWRLTDEWVRSDALSTLEAWSEGGRVYMWFPREEGGAGGGREPLTFHGWDPALERWAQWENWVRGRFAQTLAHYHAAQIARVLKAGMMPTDTRLRSHFVWLARYQVLKESIGRVARWAQVGHSSTVRRAVHSLAHRVDLTLRTPTPGGRPPRRNTTRRK